MNCEYCDGDRDGYVSRLPKANKGFNAYVWKSAMSKLIVTGIGREGIFNINYCPMCGKKIVE